MGFLRKFMGNPVSSKADHSVLAHYTLPHIDPIERYDDAKSALRGAHSTEEAIAIVRAYVLPKVEERGAMGDPLKALDCLDMDVPERRDEIQLVRRAVGLHRGAYVFWDVPLIM